jgi:predicted DNA-binding ribbon-helix-helix protein
MARQLIESSPRLETARSSNQLEDSSYKTIRVFARKPHENDNRLINRTKRARGSGEDFASFYSPTHHQYDQVQKGRIDINTIFARSPLNNKGDDSIIKLNSDKNQ